MINDDIHLDDLLSKRDKGETACTRFLNEAEVALCERYLASRKEDFILFGGYDGCIRTRLILPAYWDKDTLDTSDYVTSVKIKGTAYRELSHSDFLGSITGCGISRNAVGDIVVSDDKTEAVVFCTPDIAAFLLESPDTLEYVGRDKVKITEYKVDASFSPKRQYEEFTAFVSSLRLDCVVGAVLKTSRENAKSYIFKEKVTLNYLPVKDNDCRIEKSDVLTVRGKGKYRISDLSETKKGRIRITVLKFI